MNEIIVREHTFHDLTAVEVVEELRKLYPNKNWDKFNNEICNPTITEDINEKRNWKFKILED